MLIIFASITNFHTTKYIQVLFFIPSATRSPQRTITKCVVAGECEYEGPADDTIENGEFRTYQNKEMTIPMNFVNWYELNHIVNGKG